MVEAGHGPRFRVTSQTGTRRRSFRGVFHGRAPGKAHRSPAHGSFLAKKHMRAAAGLDLASVSDFPEFHTLAEQDLTNHILSIDP
jgi:hypothetical protein